MRLMVKKEKVGNVIEDKEYIGKDKPSFYSRLERIWTV